MMEDEKGETPLDIAAAYGNREILALFVRKRECMGYIRNGP